MRDSSITAALYVISLVLVARMLLQQTSKLLDSGETRVSRKCCFATTYNSTNILNLLVLGHSYSNFPVRFPFFLLHSDSIKSEDLKLLKKYFTLYMVKKYSRFEEEQYWSIKSHNPVIAVTNFGFFEGDPSKLCKEAPFAAVSKRGAVHLFDTSLMVINPATKPNFKYHESFENSLHSFHNDWRLLNPSNAVTEYPETQLEWWFSFGKPVFIIYTKDTFINVSSNLPTSNTSISRILRSHFYFTMSIK